MASYGLTDIEDVGILVQNNEKAINGLHGEGERVCIKEKAGWRERERERERERQTDKEREKEREREKHSPLPFVQGCNAHCFHRSEKRLHRD